MSIYEQVPLLSQEPSFRLLELENRGVSAYGDNDTIFATIKTYATRDTPQYEALSYTWGKREGQLKIDLNGLQFPVTPNLHAAFQQLRIFEGQDSKLSRTLWVDAICINQADNAEKSHQVMRMKDIYANASEVLIWLGSSDDSTGVAFNTLERFAADDGTPDGSSTCHDLLDTADERRVAIQNFIQRPYFDRVWVIQELVVARSATVLCGPFSLSWDKVYTAMERITGSGFYPFSPVTSKVTNLGMWRKSSFELDSQQRDEAFDLRVLIMDPAYKRATDLRDKVYSLCGIASRAFAMGITIDYDKSVEQVYIDSAKHFLRIRTDLRLLSAVKLRHRKSSSLHLPSWVPDWSQSHGPEGVLSRYYRFVPEKMFRASGTSQSRVTLLEDSNVIRLDGIHLDSVRAVVRIKALLAEKDNQNFTVTEAKLRKIVVDMVISETYSLTSEPCWKALFRTLTADRTVLSPRIKREYRDRFLTPSASWTLDGDEPDNSISPNAWAEISRPIESIIHDKDMFLTTKGYLGLGEEGLQVGDQVCIFLGGEVPFLIRQLEHCHDGKFEFLAECYVHGVMDGEMMANLEQHDIKPFWIK